MGEKKYWVEPGSIYAPGWHVRYEKYERFHVSVGCFDAEADAQEYCDLLNSEEE